LARSKVQDGVSLLDSAVSLGFVNEEAALRAIADEVGLEFIDLDETVVELSLL
jgi:general secretion pathway protein E/type IV pilus assembly protein PilB